MVSPCVAAGINALGLLLATSTPGENVFLSPLSIGETLGMVAAGATQNSASEQQLAAALRCASGRDVTDGFASWHRFAVRAGQSAPGDVDFAIENSLWLKGTIMASYTRELQRVFGAGAHPLRSKEDINKEVAEKTHGKIPELLKSDIDPNTIAMLVNAVYFKGAWRFAFNATLTDTRARFFTQAALDGDTSDTASLTLPMMKHRFEGGQIRFAQDMPIGGAAAATQVTADICMMPYGASGAGAPPASVHDRYSAVFIVPSGASRGLDVGRALEAVAAHDARRGSAAMMADIPPARGPVTVRLPRFALDAGAMNLASALAKRANLTAVFSPAANDQLLRMTPRSDAHIGDVVHRAVVEVNEEGSTAAAATAAGIHTMALPAPPTEFTVDRPFVFGIWDAALQVWLFLGKVGRPGQA